MNDSDYPAEIIERAMTTRGEIQLQRRGNDYEIISNGTFLMATYNGESERLLVRSALQYVSQPQHVLIGGLGVGFSLQEALLDPRVEQVTVIEIEQKIIDWNKTELADVSDRAVEHLKTRVIHADLIDWIGNTNEQFDLICLDIDNGPDWKVFEQNHSLYHESSFCKLHRLLQPGGCITFWSANASPVFAERMEQYFGNVEVLDVEQSHGEPDYIFLSRKLEV
ncbi:spermine/spermidine synthase [Paenibacillus sp. D2_2]|uniref:spermine/spermidine synthase domain-containing protein n=1 Tax=Paenibacillus sp. D2_2 TaxID=3073092 RepID=UPI002815F52E|nr:spermine/spermidine synthase [Paenibacillus sp. D2_2]WMT42970.1 spermine/spermidine synthase [Paenibacillus sp. D2_2]